MILYNSKSTNEPYHQTTHRLTHIHIRTLQTLTNLSSGRLIIIKLHIFIE